MKQQKLLTLSGIVWLLCFSFLARGQAPITINGPDTMCKDNIGVFNITTTTGNAYTWSVTSQGNLLGTSTIGITQTKNILWVGTGLATITVQGFDVNNILVQFGTKQVYIVSAPNVFLTSNAQVACTNLDSVTYDIRPEEECDKYCEYSQVIYTANGDPGGSFTWNVTGALSYSASGNTCTVNWGATGFGQVTVTDTSEHGCIVTVTKCIEIIGRPKALFDTQPLAVNDTVYICDSTNVVFTDNSVGSNTSPIVSWLWNFGDGSTSTQPGSNNNPLSHQYNGPGTYLATLVVTNLCGCSDTDSVWVVVAPEVGAQIACPSVVCEFDTAIYSVQSCGNWDVIGGTITSSTVSSVTVVWDNVGTSGFGYVTFTPSPACSPNCPQPTTVKVPVIQQHGTIEGPLTVCPMTAYLYKLPQWPSTEYNWYIESSNGAVLSPSDQPNEIVLNSGYGSSGPQVIKIRVNYKNTLLGCGGLAEIKIIVLPQTYVSGDEKVCLNTTNTYDLSPGSFSGDWTLTYPDNSTVTGSGNSFNGFFDQVGTYHLSITSPLNDFCPPDPMEINVFPPPPTPDSIAGPTVICRGVPLEYTAYNNLPGTIFQWAAVNGSVNPASGDVTYATFLPNTGPFSIMVWRTETNVPYCNSDTLILPLDTPIIIPTIVGLDSVCPSSYENYFSTYTDGETYYWEILSPNQNAGSINPANGSANVNILWNDMGSSGLLVDLVVKVRKCTGWYTDTQKVYIRGIPNLSLSIPATACAEELVNMSLLPSNIVGTGTTISWNFGDGITQMGGVNISHSYATFPGTGPIGYTVSVTVTNPYGCTGTYTVSDVIYIKPAPVAFITPMGPFSYCDPTTFSVPLNATVQSGYGTATAFDWFWSGSGTSIAGCTSCTTSSYTVTETNYGMGNYFVIATNSFGCSDTSNIVKFYEYCPDICTPLNPVVKTVSKSMIDCGQMLLTGNVSSQYYGYWITPGAASTSGTNPITVTYDVAGLYSATYRAAVPSLSGDTCYIDSTVHFVIPYIADLLYDITCDVSNPGFYEVTLIDHSTVYPGTSLTYTFLIDNVVQQTGSSTSFQTSLPFGSYNLQLEITDGISYTCYDAVLIDIPHWPHANFTWDLGVNPCAIDTGLQFTNLSTGSNLSNWWDFADGSGNTQPNPKKVWSSFGPYDVVLTVTDEYGCVDDTTRTVIVESDVLINGSISALPTTACEGNPVTLTYAPIGSLFYPTNYEWIYNGTTYGYGTTSTTNVYNTGAYWVIGTNANYCKVVTPAIPVSFIELPPANITGDNHHCVREQFTLSAYVGPGPYIYQWSIDGGPWFTYGPEYTTQFNTPGTHTFQVKIRVPDGIGGFCEEVSGIFTVEIHPLPPPPMVTFTMLDCPSYLLELNGSNIVPGFYNWSNGTSGTPAYTYQGGDYICMFTDLNGCTSQTGFSVPKDPDTYLWTFPTGCYNFCELSMPRTIVGPIIPFDYWAYLKNLTPDLTGTFSVPLPYSLSTAGLYNMVLDNGLCADTSGDMHVTIDTNCRDCGVPPPVRVVAVWQTGSPLGPECFDSLTVQFINGSPGSMGFNVTAMNGMLIPYSGSVPPGVTNVSFRYVADVGFSGLFDELIFTLTMPDGSLCIARVKIEIRPCGNQFAPRLAGNGEGNEEEDGRNKPVMADNGAHMLLVPNPATNSTRVDYGFGDGKERYVEVYDLAGRKMARHKVTQANGSVQLELAEYANGMYLVVIRENGQVMLQSKLTIVK